MAVGALAVDSGKPSTRAHLAPRGRRVPDAA